MSTRPGSVWGGGCRRLIVRRSGRGGFWTRGGRAAQQVWLTPAAGPVRARSGGDSPQTRSALWPAGYKPALNPLEPKTVSCSQPRGFPTLLPILCQPNRGREAPAKGQTLLAEAGTRGGGRGVLCCPGRQVQSRPDTGVASHPDPFAQNTRHMKQGGFPLAVTEPTGSSGEAASPRSGRSARRAVALGVGSMPLKFMRVPLPRTSPWAVSCGAVCGP